MSPTTIYVIRHAWAGHFGDPGWSDDSQRPLTEDGRRRFTQVVKQLIKRGFAPEIIASSPYVRCRQTADIVAKHVAGSPQVVEIAALKPHSDMVSLFEWTRLQECDEVAWVGHAPDVGYLTATLLGDCGSAIRFAKGACAAVRLDGTVGDAVGQLHWLATAKLLGC